MNARQQIPLLIHFDRAKAIAIIIEALKTNEMHHGRAAEQLGVSQGTISRWISRLEMNDAVEAERQLALKEGRHYEYVRKGYPKGKKRAASEWTDERRARVSASMKKALRRKKRARA